LTEKAGCSRAYFVFSQKKIPIKSIMSSQQKKSNKRKRRHKLGTQKKRRIKFEVVSLDQKIGNSSQIPGLHKINHLLFLHQRWYRFLEGFIPSVLCNIILQYLNQQGHLKSFASRPSFLLPDCRNFFMNWSKWYTNSTKIELYALLILGIQHFHSDKIGWSKVRSHPFPWGSIYPGIDCHIWSKTGNQVERQKFTFWCPPAPLSCWNQGNCYEIDKKGENLVVKLTRSAAMSQSVPEKTVSFLYEIPLAIHKEGQ
jgi:hypothetical protein